MRLGEFPKSEHGVNPVHKNDDGKWYFWCECWSNEIGPWSTEADAREAMAIYGHGLDAQSSCMNAMNEVATLEDLIVVLKHDCKESCKMIVALREDQELRAQEGKVLSDQLLEIEEKRPYWLWNAMLDSFAAMSCEVDVSRPCSEQGLCITEWCTTCAAQAFRKAEKEV